MFMGDRLKDQREKRGFSQQELGDVLGISRSAIQKQESGKSKSIDTLSLELLSVKLNCSPAYLMGWTDDPDVGLPKEKPATKNDDGLSAEKQYLLNQIAVMTDDDVAALNIIVEQVIRRHRK